MRLLHSYLRHCDVQISMFLQLISQNPILSSNSKLVKKCIHIFFSNAIWFRCFISNTDEIMCYLWHLNIIYVKTCRGLSRRIKWKWNRTGDNTCILDKYFYVPILFVQLKLSKFTYCPNIGGAVKLEGQLVKSIIRVHWYNIPSWNPSNQIKWLYCC